jgi:glycosyltransferase involved in cell wall biosynthesis
VELNRFSIAVPAYNAEATLAETLSAVSNQTYGHWECVVVDDGSTDETPRIVESYGSKDDRIRLVQQENQGTAGAYRTAIAESTADLIVICSADDLLLPNHLEVMSELIEAHPDYEIYSSNGEYLQHETGLRRQVYGELECSREPEWSLVRSLSFEEVATSCFYSVGAVIRRMAYERAGGHRLGAYTEDYDLWLRAMARGARHIYTPEVLSVHRVSRFQKSTNLKRLYQSNLEVYEHLLATERLSSRQADAVKVAIADTRACLESEQLAVDTAMGLQAEVLRGAVERVVGPARTESAMQAIHLFSWVARPFRKWVAAARHRRSGS